MTEKQGNERVIFEAFLGTDPAFAGEPLAKWWQPEDEQQFPDVEAISTSGKSVGIELGEWLNQDEMQAAKAKERLEQSILEAVGEQGKNTSEHILYVWLRPKPKARVKRSTSRPFARSSSRASTRATSGGRKSPTGRVRKGLSSSTKNLQPIGYSRSTSTRSSSSRGAIRLQEKSSNGPMASTGSRFQCAVACFRATQCVNLCAN